MGQEHIEWVFDDAKDTIISRGEERDQPDGERTIPRCVTAFNAITGHKLSNCDGWLFMEILKRCRSVQGAYKYDDFRDGVGYAALRAEEARMENEPQETQEKKGTVRRLTEVERQRGFTPMTEVELTPNEKILLEWGITASPGQVFGVCMKHQLMECTACDFAFVPPECDQIRRA